MLSLQETLSGIMHPASISQLNISFVVQVRESGRKEHKKLTAVDSYNKTRPPSHDEAEVDVLMIPSNKQTKDVFINRLGIGYFFACTGFVYTTSPPITVISGSIFQISSAGTVM